MIRQDSSICLLFGGNKLNAGVLQRFHEWGCDVIVVDWNESPALRGDLHLRLDVKIPEPIIAELKRLGLDKRIKTGYTSIDVAVPALAQVLKLCGLSVNSDEGLANCFSKGKMTEIWNRHNLLNREVRRFSDWSEDLVQWNKTQKIIVKPDNAASSRGITVLPLNVRSDEIQNAFNKAKENAPDGLVVVEEFVEGTEYTVEMLGDGEGHVAVYAISKKSHTKHAGRNRIAVKLHYNAVSCELQKEIANYAIKCYKALEFRSSFGHLEIIQKEDGSFSPVEIGARSSGFIASHLVDFVSGHSFLEDLLSVQMGASVSDGLVCQSPRSAMLFFYDFPVGRKIVREASLLDYCPDGIVSHVHDRNFIRVGNVVPQIDSDNARLGMEVLEGPKALMTEACIAKAESDMLKDILE